MRRTNATVLKVEAPSKGLLTRFPPDLQDKEQYVVVAENVRADKQQLRAAPGYERIHTPERALEGAPNLIHQPDLTGVDREQAHVPVVGTETELLLMEKRSRELVCPVTCSLRFAATADSGKIGANLAAVANLIRGWSPDLVVHAGDLVYADGGMNDQDNPYETMVAQYYWWAIGGYNGRFGQGPTGATKFLPAVGNHDYDDASLARFLAFFHLPGNATHYTVKRGPVQFFFVDSYGYGPSGTGPGGGTVAGTGASPGEGAADLSSTGPQAVWLQAALAASDCPWRVVVWHHPPQTSEDTYYPGYSVLNWPLGDWGADVLITGHSHVYERILRADGVTHFIVGNGGHTLRGLHSPAVSGSQAAYSDKYGALRVDVTNTTFSAAAYDVDGTLRDSVALTATRPASVCYVGSMARQLSALRVSPPTVNLSVGQRFPLRAYASYTDGSSMEVTAASVWSSAAPSVASVDSAGKVTGGAIGTVLVSADYQGLMASATIHVEKRCSDHGGDFVLIYDRSGSMSTDTPPAGTRIERLKEAAGLFLDSLQSNDRVATVSYGGYAHLDHDLTDNVSVARAAVDALTPYGPTSTAEAIQLATDQMQRNGRATADKVIILFTDGFANLPAGTTLGMAAARDAAQAAKDAGSTFVVVGFDLRWNPYYEGLVKAWATCPDLYYSIVEVDVLLAVYAQLRSDLCHGICSSGAGVGLSLFP